MPPRLRLSFALAVAAAIPAAGAAREPVRPAVPVLVGGDPAAPACDLWQIIGLDDAVVRSAPRASGTRLARLRNGHRIWRCGVVDGFVAAVYDPSGRSRDCGVARPWPERRAYAGPCRTGFIDIDAADVAEDGVRAPAPR